MVLLFPLLELFFNTSRTSRVWPLSKVSCALVKSKKLETESWLCMEPSLDPSCIQGWLSNSSISSQIYAVHHETQFPEWGIVQLSFWSVSTISQKAQCLLHHCTALEWGLELRATISLVAGRPWMLPGQGPIWCAKKLCCFLWPQMPWAIVEGIWRIFPEHQLLFLFSIPNMHVQFHSCQESHSKC